MYFIAVSECGSEEVAIYMISKQDVEKVIRLKVVWSGMHIRCNDMDNRNYGGKGIRVCEEWSDFYCFYIWAVSGYEFGLQLDRIDSQGNYCPENCRWVTVRDNINNRSNTRTITWKGQTKPISVWAQELGVSYHILKGRQDMGWPVEEMMTLPKIDRKDRNKINIGTKTFAKRFQKMYKNS